MKLSFKGDKKSKKVKRSRAHSDDDGDAGGSSSSSKRKSSKREEVADPGAWVFPEAANEITGPTFLWAPTEPPTCVSVRPCAPPAHVTV